MKKNIILTIILTLIQIIIITIIKGFSYPLLLLFLMLLIFSYISIEDWKTGEISIPLNIATFVLAGLYSFFSGWNLKVIGLNLLCFVLPFIILEVLYEIFSKDKEKFLIGGGDIILFASMSLILSPFNMCVMLFFACLMSIIASKIIKKTLVHFAPFIQAGFLTAFLFGDFLSQILFFY